MSGARPMPERQNPSDVWEPPHPPGEPGGAVRKREHLRINLEEDVGAKGVTTGFERYRLVHQALPELDLAAVDTSLTLFGRRLRAPLIISSMTGGTEEGARLNRVLAEVAQALGIGMGVGSQRVAVEDGPAAVRSFQVRPVAPDVLLFANLGAVQLNYGFGPAECRRVVEMIEADALVLHLNPLQEAVQPGGTTNFAGLARRIAAVCRALPVPVVVKEVGWGISAETARLLAEAGVAAIDVAGAGGTSWSEVEKHRAPTERARRVAAAFAGWGIPTADSLRLCRAAAPGLPLIASGGIRDGIDVAKAIALGATAAGMAGPALRAAAVSADALTELLGTVIEVLRIAMFCTGARDLAALARVPLLRVED
jgi:isopentenyl-diphosphate delta-isomerase